MGTVGAYIIVIKPFNIMKSLFNHRVVSLTSRYLPVMACVIALLGVSGNIITASGQVGGAAVVFLKIEPDSRAAGMGNAGVALADNASATFWNPAGLAFQEGTELGLTHSNWLPEFNAGLFYEYFMAKKILRWMGYVRCEHHVSFPW